MPLRESYMPLIGSYMPLIGSYMLLIGSDMLLSVLSIPSEERISSVLLSPCLF